MRKFLWNLLTSIYPIFLRNVYKMNIGNNVVISHKAKLDKSINPRGIFIGNNTWILSGSIILAHDHSRSIKVNTYIGNNCIIGINSIILPGVKIGNHVVIGAGSVVTKDIEDNCVAVGNPATIIRHGIKINDNGQIIS